jgi:ferric-dicitrate binding protein FerR (iron transport regulator)
MNREQTRLQYLWEQYISKSASKGELDELFSLFQQHDNEEIIRSLLEQYLAKPDSAEAIDPAYWLNKLGSIKADASTAYEAIPPVHRIQFLRRPWLRYAAAVILLVLIAAIGVITNKRRHEQTIAQPKFVQNEVFPGGNRAILTLANGQQILLDSTRNGALSVQGKAEVVKADSGLLTYTINKSGKGEVVYNTIIIPRGGQYQIILPDGTHAWLNSASSLTFPTSFMGKDRRVTLDGEGYFEVTRNDAQPFIVVAGKTEVAVLGTHFDIMAYRDEKSVNTTLLEGLVRVTAEGQQQVLKPGEQAVVDNKTGVLSSGEVDVNRVISWKNGLFDFKGADVYTIMRQVARWYDVQIEYRGDLSDIKLSGIISRRAYASQLLKLLEATERIRFVPEGDKIIVSPFK